MKKIVTVIAFALICSGAFAQFNKGRYLVGGGLSFSGTTVKDKTGSTTSTYSHNTDFTLNPSAGYFIIDKLAVGAGLGLSSSSVKGDGTNNFKNTGSSFTLSPFARYYLDPGIFFQAQVGFGSGSSKDKSGPTTVTTKYSLSNWALSAGYAYFLNDFVAIEPSVGFKSNTSKAKSTSNKTIESGLFLNIGLQVYLGPRN